MWKTQRVDIETRLDKMDYSFAYNDAFLQAVIKDEEWYLFDLVEAPEIHEAFYTMKAGPYMQLVKEEIAKGKKTKKVKARDILRGMLIARNETGRMYSINVTRVNEHSPFIDVVRLSNLCVAPETQILTKRGYVPIAELEGEKVEVWNGKEWSEVDVVKTGVDQKLIKVTTNSGYEIECTPYHKFYISTAYHSPYKEVRACDLKPGDKLAKFDLPVVDGEEELENAYINGFYSGDGCLTDQGQRIYLYGEKRQLAEFFNEGGKWTIQDDLNRQYNHFRTLKDKYFVPSNGFTVKSRLDWLAGYLDADGCVYRNGGNEQLVASSVEKNFLREVQMMLQTLGVSAKITKMGDEGFRLMPANDGSGELKEFWCQESYRLLITSCDAYKLQSMGLKLNRLKLTMQKPQRDAKQFVKIVSVLDEGRVDDTYCFTEPKRHMGMFNGLLTGQCQEITLPTKAYKNMPDLYSEESEGETAFCTLAAINAGKVGFDEYEHNAGVALRAVDRMIDLAPMMTKSMENSIRKRRSAGIGIMGLASALYNNGLDYDGTEASLGFVSKLAEHHYFYLLKASQKLAEEAGYGVGGINLNWLPIDTRVNKYPLTLDWESLRGKPRKNSVLAAHMPTESSALFSDGPNSVYPPRQAVINKKSRKGLVQYICKEWDSSKKLAWDVDNITLAKYYSAIQDMTDQAISADYYFDPSKYADEKKPLSELMKEWVAQAKMGNKTQYYMNTRDYNGGSVQDVMKASVPEEESCESCKL
jgi:ribonucleoside-diphosphate reductase alpha chain